MGELRDPAGMPTKILSSGRMIFAMAKGTVAIDFMVPILFDGILLVQGQVEVSAIRFSPTSLSDLSAVPWGVRHYR